MKAVLLTGGFGTRLRPLTYTRPKPLLPIANRPHLTHVLDALARHGVTGVVVTTSYLPESFSEVVEDSRAGGMTVEVAHEPEPLGTAGAIKNAEAFVGDDSFLVFNGDVLTDLDLGLLLERHRSWEAEATIVLTPVEDPSAFGVVPTDGTGRVQGFIEKPAPEEAVTNLINAGIYLFEPSVLDRIPAGAAWSAERQLFPELVAEGSGLFAFGTDAYWIDIGTPEKYLQANLDALAGRIRSESIEPPGEDRVLAAADVHIEDGARVSSSCLGAGVEIQPGASVVESVLLPGVLVGSDASVVRSILGQDVLVQPGARAVDATIADGDKVTSG